MEYHISDRMKTLKPSAIREIFKYAADPAVISLAAGDPAPETLPVEDIRRLMGEVLGENPMKALLYSQSEGHPPLRQAVRDWVKERYHSVRDDDDVMIISGAQQCMDLTCKVLCNEGDTVICEDPSFIGSLNCFRSYNTNLVGVPIEDDGICLEGLEDALKANPNTRLIYVIPNFHNPTGISMSLAKRKGVYRLAQQYGAIILEDNPYGDLQFAGEKLPTIKSMDTDGIVVYAGTFSKILSTGIRVGYMVVPKGLTAKMTVAKQCADVHTSMPAQLLCTAFLAQCDIDAHIAGIKEIYREKCTHLLSEMEKHFPKEVSWTRPTGGLFVWVTVPERLDVQEFATALVRDHKVCVVPGSAFGVDAQAVSHCFRVNFSMPSKEKISTAIPIIGQALRAALAEK